MAELLSNQLGDELVTIFVGPVRKKFSVHKELICNSADFFHKAFTNGFKETHDGELYMPEDSADAFAFLVEWIYRDRIPPPGTDAQKHAETLFEFSMLSTKLCLEAKLRDKIMDQIQDVHLDNDLYDSVETARRVYEKVGDGDALRDFCRDMLAWEAKQRCQTFANSKTEDGFYTDATNNSLFESLWKLSSESCDFFKDFSFTFGVLSEKSGDARMRDEDDERDRCWYHCHTDTESCRP